MIGLVLSPFVVAILAAWLASRYPRWTAALAGWPAVLCAVFANEMRNAIAGGPRLVELPWAPSLGLSLSFNLDGLGLLFATLITGIGALVVLYASRYLEGHAQAGRFYASLFAFMGAMLGTVLSDNVLTLFVFWELTGFTSYLLIGFEHERAGARSAALQALIVTGAGGLALLAAGVLLAGVSGTTSLASMVAERASIVASPFYGAIAGLVLLAAFTKSAQVPFHFWLPNAMAAPTPVSAYLHSATMVKAGVYLVARMTPVLGWTTAWTTAVTLAGAATMVLGAYRSVQETDLKRILAYSTVSALGVLTMLLGVGTREAIIAALVYLVAHAGYKGALFLVAGAIEHETGTRDLSALAGLRRAMPLTALAGGAAALSMAGVPLTLGFVGKDGAYDALLGATHWFPWPLALMVLASILLGLAGVMAGVLPFRGEAPSERAIHDPAWPLWLPPLLLAAGGLVAGIAPWIVSAPLSAAATAIAGMPLDATLSAWHGLTPALLLSALTLAAVGLAYLVHAAVRTGTWKPRWGSEDLYEGALIGLGAASRAIGPPLHGASLRTYVMVIVVASVLIGGAALLSDAGPISAAPRTSVRVHDVLIVLLIVGGAIAAAMARSTMSAVLALGAVGYGVAFLFLNFGAPDLAMTQFSVETLTVLIYVLVFRHFRGFGQLSPRLVRARDVLIAAGIGIFIGGLLGSVATTETAPRLREYFAQFGPTLGHGRNIVNVILVDFRAFDTLGEITVLATAALGVRALMRLAADGRSDHQPVPPVASPIFRTAARLLMPLLLVFAVFLLLRGHNQPGGGFVGGLIAAAAFALYGIAFGVHRARQALPARPLTLLGAGLVIALASGVPAALLGQPFLTAIWPPAFGSIGTPAVFDVGVFLVVAGVVLMMIFSLAEES
ncbi:MAG TPA: Na+/H+ antiporter subunit B [Vicinamibacterales bacterium]|nr:Na+/H+ antiporter subunit B [Vicinamibacterales bacterium]